MPQLLRNGSKGVREFLFASRSSVDPGRARLKVWARAKILPLEENPELANVLIDVEYGAHVERICVFTLEAFDWNCPRHIPRRYTRED